MQSNYADNFLYTSYIDSQTFNLGKIFLKSFAKFLGYYFFSSTFFFFGKYLKFLTDKSLVLLFIGLFSFYFAFFSIYFDTSFRNLEFYKPSIFSFYKEFLTLGI